MNKLLIWIEAFRLRTLPLALSSAVLGSFLAYADGQFNPIVFVLAISTTVLLQILSNLANDFGDSMHGTDNKNRLGPIRTVQSGKISKTEMKWLIVVFVILSFFSGGLLIFKGIKGANTGLIILFFILGIASIIAAVKYTIGKNPYGYSGFGDLFVFIFFGLIGVCGTYFLHTNQFHFMQLLPAASIGFLSAGVLNLNNMRDIENDRNSGKNTIVVRMGSANAKTYHSVLILTGLLTSVVFVAMNGKATIQWLFLLSYPLFLSDLIQISKITSPKKFDPFLKKLSLATLLFTLLFGLGIILSHS
jgi:1,4-dihydroxy-2-naphthoate polyprenyltransferase